MIGLVAYSATCAYANFIAPNPTTGASTLKLPDVKTAQYSVEYAGNVLFTSSYEVFGKVTVLHGYWEIVGRDFKYRSRDMILDEALFGKITVKKRLMPTPTETPGVQKPK